MDQNVDLTKNLKCAKMDNVMNYVISEHDYCANVWPNMSPDQPDIIQPGNPILPDQKESRDGTKTVLDKQEVQYEDSNEIDQVPTVQEEYEPDSSTKQAVNYTQRQDQPISSDEQEPVNNSNKSYQSKYILYLNHDEKVTYLTVTSPELKHTDLNKPDPHQVNSNLDDIKECHNYTTSQNESFHDSIINNVDHNYVCNKVINIKEVKQNQQPKFTFKTFSSSEFDSSDEFSVGDLGDISDTERVEIVFDNLEDMVDDKNDKIENKVNKSFTKIGDYFKEEGKDCDKIELPDDNLKCNTEENLCIEKFKDNSLLDNVGDEFLDNDFLCYLDSDQLPPENQRIFDLMLQNESFSEVFREDGQNSPNITLTTNRSPEHENKVLISKAKEGKRNSFVKVLKSVRNIFSNNITFINKEIDVPIEKYLRELRKLDKMERSLMCLKYDRENMIKTKKIKKNINSENKENDIKFYSCNICDKQFDKEPALTEHINSHKKKYSCSQCAESFDLVTDWVQHFNTHVLTKVFKCIPCKKSFDSLGKYRNHLSRLHPETRQIQTSNLEEETNIAEESSKTRNTVTAVADEDSDASSDNDSDSENEISEDTSAEAKDHEEAVARSIDHNLSLRPKLVCDYCSEEYITTLVQSKHVTKHMMEDIIPISSEEESCRTCKMLNINSLRIVDTVTENFYFTCHNCFKILQTINVEDDICIKVELDAATGDNDDLSTSNLGDIMKSILADDLAAYYSLSSSDTDSDTSDSSCDSEHLLFDFDTSANDNLDCDNTSSDQKELDEMEYNDMIEIKEVKTDINNLCRQNQAAEKILSQKRRVDNALISRQKSRVAETAPIFISTCENGMFSEDSDSGEDFDLDDNDDIEFEYEFVKEEII